MAPVEPVPESPSPDPVLSLAPADALAGLDVAGRLGESTWLARLGDGTEVAARWLAPAPGTASSPILVGRATPLAEIDSAELVPVHGVALRPDAVWLVSALDGGIPLQRLVQLVGLSQPQAALVAAGIVDGVAELHTLGLGHGRLHAGNVHVGADGAVRLGDWAPSALLPADSGDGLHAADLAAARTLAAALIAGAHGGAPAGAPDPKDLVAAIELSADIPMLSTVLDEALPTPSMRDRTRGELAALVAAVQRPSAVVPALRVVDEPSRRAAPTQRAAPAERRQPPLGGLAWLWKLVAALAALALVIGVEAAVLGDRIVRDLQTLRSPLITQPAQASGSRTALPVLGVASAGLVTRVEARPLQSCAAGEACVLRVTVQIQPQSRPTHVGWSVTAVDRCRGRAVVVARGDATVARAGDHAAALQKVRLPQATALAVGVVTTSPARAASRAFPVPAGRPVC
jgi:hypothetical protein